ncbi:MAG: DUF86 domain-containing protein [Gammaproteobacteria bacterium]|nr:DUF86 domain-containing protein [Gammaproteobacteria bacterium]
MIDRTILARRVAAVRDAADRIREVLPAQREAFVADRAAREIVTLNLFVALQECLSLAAHWLADAGWEVPGTYAHVFRALAERGVLDHDLAVRMAAAAGLRNLIAHRYGTLDWTRIHDVASNHIEDLLRFCDVLADAAVDGADKS